MVLFCIGLFIRSYHDSGPTGAAQLPTLPTPSSASSSGSSSTPGAADNFFPKPGETVTLGKQVFAVEPGGFVFKGATPHHVVLTANSTAPIGRVGYLVPTSADHSYGLSKNVGTGWSLSTDAYGKPQYALVFIQAGSSGVPITCSVTVDGRTVNSSTTHGPYGRAVCVG